MANGIRERSPYYHDPDAIHDIRLIELCVEHRDWDPDCKLYVLDGVPGITEFPEDEIPEGADDERTLSEAITFRIDPDVWHSLVRSHKERMLV